MDQLFHLPHTEINKEKWDMAVDAAANGNIYANSWYLDITAPGWNAIVNDDYSVVVPLPWNKKFGISYVYPPFFIQQLGVFTKRSPINADLNTVIELVIGNYRFAEMQWNAFNQVPKAYVSRMRNNYMLDLSAGADQLRSNYSENHRRNIKKARQSGFRVVNVEQPDVIISMFREHRGMSVKQLENRHYSLFHRLTMAAFSHNSCEILHAIDEKGRTVAGAVFFKFRNTWYFIFSATASGARNTGAPHLILDHFIENKSRQGVILDFEGSDQPELARYYQGFGGINHPYPFIRINQLPIPFRWFK